MSKFEQKDNSGALFRNDEKREGKQDADYRGSATVDGVEYWIDAWVNESKSGGKKYFGLKLKRKDVKDVAPRKPAARSRDDGFVPF